MAPGKHTVRFEFDYEGGGAGKGGIDKLFVDVCEVASTKIERTIGFRIWLDETFGIGMDAGEPVSESYPTPFDFTGRIDKVVVKLGRSDG